MGTIMVFIVTLGLYHFILNGAILPNQRLLLRMKLANLQSRLLIVKTDNPDLMSDWRVKLIAKLIDFISGHLRDMSLLLIIRALRKQNNSPELKQEIQNLKTGINSPETPKDLKKIYNDVVYIALKSVVLNFLHWPILILVSIPFVLIFLIVSLLTPKVVSIKSRLKDGIEFLSLLPEKKQREVCL